MINQGGMFSRIKKVILILLLISAGFFCWQNIFAEELININTAGAEELDALPGIGAVKAQAIVDYRNSNGLFQTIEDIMNVPGIGSVTFNNIKKLITVGSNPAETIPAPYCGDGNLDESEECDDSNNQNNDGCSANCLIETSSHPPFEEDGDEQEQEEIISNPSIIATNNLGDIVINEFVSDPTDNDVEWIELYNNTNKEIDLTDWTIEEGSEAKTT
ncbi:helix-hairpin-helix domain-containing protein, partial [Candidatus Parcubacteria bacterium]|nr:helix-hairpin-helix domain-containing protein [Candidatus Parcubacteria bacterium]